MFNLNFGGLFLTGEGIEQRLHLNSSVEGNYYNKLAAVTSHPLLINCPSAASQLD